MGTATSLFADVVLGKGLCGLCIGHFNERAGWQSQGKVLIGPIDVTLEAVDDIPQCLLLRKAGYHLHDHVDMVGHDHVAEDAHLWAPSRNGADKGINLQAKGSEGNEGRGGRGGGRALRLRRRAHRGGGPRAPSHLPKEVRAACLAVGAEQPFGVSPFGGEGLHRAVVIGNANGPRRCLVALAAYRNEIGAGPVVIPTIQTSQVAVLRFCTPPLFGHGEAQTSAYADCSDGNLLAIHVFEFSRRRGHYIQISSEASTVFQSVTVAVTLIPVLVIWRL